MWVCQCIMIWPIWWVAHSVYNKPVTTQIVINLLFFIAYSFFWFGPVQDCIRFLHQHLQQITVPVEKRLPTPVDTSVKYQILKHCFRLSWFFLANYFYHYRREEERRLLLAVANKELQLKLLKWYLNPRFYFETINHLKQLSLTSPASCTRPILHLAKVMEYVIYESREKLIDVSKEIHFLNHYVELINRQNSHTARITVTTKALFKMNMR
jgi:Histidine kinase